MVQTPNTGMGLQIAIASILIASALLGLAGGEPGLTQVAPSNTPNAQAGILHPEKQADKWGYADASGKMLIAPQFKDARQFSEGLAAVLVEISAPSKIRLIDPRGVPTGIAAQSKWGFIADDGTMVIPPQFEAGGDFSEGLVAASLEVPWSGGDTWGYVNRQGKMAIKPQFNLAHPFSEGLALVWAGGVRLTDPFVRSFVNMGFIDHSGRWEIRSKFNYFFFEDFSNGLVAYRRNFGKWGYMGKDGKTVIKSQFDWAGRFSDGSVAAVVLDGSCAHIDKSGRVIGQPEPLKAPWRRPKRVGTFTFNPNPQPCS